MAVWFAWHVVLHAQRAHLMHHAQRAQRRLAWRAYSSFITLSAPRGRVQAARRSRNMFLPAMCASAALPSSTALCANSSGLDSNSARGVCELVHGKNQEKLQEKEFHLARTVEELDWLVGDNLSSLTARNTAAALKYYALFITKCRGKTDRALFLKTAQHLPLVKDRFNDMADELDSMSLVTGLWSAAKLGYRPERAVFARVNGDLPEEFYSQTYYIGWLMHALAFFKFQPPPGMVESLERVILQDIPHAKTVSEILQAFPKLLLKPSAEFLMAIDASLASTEGMKGIGSIKYPETMVNALWGLSKLRHIPSDELLAAINHALLDRKLYKYKARTIPQMLFAFSLWGISPCEEVLAELDDGLAENIWRLSPHELALLVHSFCKLNYSPTDRTIHALSSAVAPALPHMDRRGVTAVASAMSKLDPSFCSLDLMNAFEAAVQPRMQHFSFQGLVTIWFSMSQIGYLPSGSFLGALNKVFLSFVSLSTTKKHPLEANDLCQILSGFTNLKCSPSTELVSAIDDAVVRTELSTKDVVEVLEAFAKLPPKHMLSPELLQKLEDLLIRRMHMFNDKRIVRSALAFGAIKQRRRNHDGSARPPQVLLDELISRIPLASARNSTDITRAFRRFDVTPSAEVYEAWGKNVIAHARKGDMNHLDVLYTVRVLSTGNTVENVQPLLEALDIALSNSVVNFYTRSDAKSIVAAFEVLGFTPNKELLKRALDTADLGD